jgi:hypothetical protein
MELWPTRAAASLLQHQANAVKAAKSQLRIAMDMKLSVLCPTLARPSSWDHDLDSVTLGVQAQHAA